MKKDIYSSQKRGTFVEGRGHNCKVQDNWNNPKETFQLFVLSLLIYKKSSIITISIIIAIIFFHNS